MLVLLTIAAVVFILLSVSLLGAGLRLFAGKSRGDLGEQMVAKSLRGLNPEHYKVFHDLYLPRPGGKGTTQVDHVVVSKYGIFVVETKYFNGWIFGDARRKLWNQSLYGHHTQFQNPLHQNWLHLQALKAALRLEESHFHSVVIFVEGDFRTEMPENVISGGICSWIHSREVVVLTDEQVLAATAQLEQLDKETDRKVAKAIHLKEMRERREKLMQSTVQKESPAAGDSPVREPGVSPWRTAFQEVRRASGTPVVPRPKDREESSLEPLLTATAGAVRTNRLRSGKATRGE